MLLLLLAVGLLTISSSVLGQDCEQVGLQCGPRCETIIYCTSVGGSGLEVDSCTPGTFCAEDSPGRVSCSASSCNGTNTETPFICLLDSNLPPVVFPDPFNISKSFLCTSSGSAPLQQCTCPEGSCFDTKTQCTKFDSNNTKPCGREVPLQCPKENFTALESDNAYFYTCDTNGVRLIRKCPNAGQEFNETEQKCLPESSPARVDISAPKDLGSCGAYVPPGGGIDPPNNGTPINCTRPGQQFQGPSCDNFYLCNNSQVPILVQCPPGEHYDADKQGCVSGKCTNTSGTRSRAATKQQHHLGLDTSPKRSNE